VRTEKLHSVSKERLTFRLVQLEFQCVKGLKSAFCPATTFHFVIPRSSRLAEASRERNDKACALCNIEG